MKRKLILPEHDTWPNGYRIELSGDAFRALSLAECIAMFRASSVPDNVAAAEKLGAELHDDIVSYPNGSFVTPYIPDADYSGEVFNELTRQTEMRVKGRALPYGHWIFEEDGAARVCVNDGGMILRALKYSTEASPPIEEIAGHFDNTPEEIARYVATANWDLTP